MEINLKGQIVIVDEAHNIEDSTREAASYSASHAKIKDALKDLHDMSERSTYHLDDVISVRNCQKTTLNKTYIALAVDHINSIGCCIDPIN